MKKERHLFPGNNTSIGFYSYYNHILQQQDANHIFCLKGGPGVGKSTFMKTIASRMKDKGFAVEYLHCSSDPDSLDGVVFPEIKVSMIDGTAPHVVDPINPGAVDEIINLGEYWDLEGIKQNKERIIQINAQVGRLFKRAYKYIAASKSLTDDVNEIITRHTDPVGAIIEADIICKKILKDDIGQLGKTRKQFISAITPKGIIHYLDTLIDETLDVYLIKNNRGNSVNSLLNRIAGEAIIRGYNTELYYCPMEPATKIEHMIIPKLKTAFISENIYYSIENKDYNIIDLTKYTNTKNLKQDQEYIVLGEENSRILLANAIMIINKAKRVHDEMEKYYVPYMDFEKEKVFLEGVLERVLGFGE